MTGFGDLHEYAWGPRVGSVALSPDGTWVALAMQTVGDTPPKYLTSIWRADTEPGSVPVRLTRSAEGEGSPAFLPDGSLAFVSRRPDGTASGGPDKPAAKDARPALWLLPAGGGEARRIAAPGGGVSGVSAARAASVLAYSAATFRGHQVGEEDAALRKTRTDAGVAAILHDSGRPRHWDHDLGAEQLRLPAAEVAAAAAAGQGRDPHRGGPLTQPVTTKRSPTMTRTPVTSDKFPPLAGPFSPGVQSGSGPLFISGQVGQDPATGELVDGDVTGQAHQALRNLTAVLEAAGKSLDDVVRIGVYLTDMGDFAAMNEVYREHLSAPYPARTAIAVAALPLGAVVEFDAIAS